MTPFQLIFGGLLATALACELMLQLMKLTRLRISLFRSAVWLAALVFILFPEVLTQAALRLRIGRGADFLLYLLALAVPAGGFYLLHAIEKQRQQITQLVRALAVNDPANRPDLRDDPDISAED